MKKLSFLSITMLLFCATVFAQESGESGMGGDITVPPVNKATVAVYVVGAGVQREIRDALSVYMLDALANSGGYRTIERSEAFLNVLDQEHIHQRSGAIDDDQIRAVGKQSGVQYICVTNITIAMGSSQISARIIDVETAEVVASGVSQGPLKTLDDLKQISAAVVFRMLGVHVQIDKNFELITSNEQAILERMIAQAVAQSIEQSSWRNRRSFWIGLGVDAVGLGIITYGIIENGNMSSHKAKHDYSKSDEARDRRNIAYGVGAAVLLAGISIQIFF